MIDGYGRTIDYVRISVTDRCNLRCVYCMPEEGVGSISHEEILRFGEIERVCQILAENGIQKIKLTGGDAGGRGTDGSGYPGGDAGIQLTIYKADDVKPSGKRDPQTHADRQPAGQSEGGAGVSGIHSAAAGSWIKNPFGA